MKKYGLCSLIVLLSGCESVSHLAPVKDLNILVHQIKNNPTDVVTIKKQVEKTHYSIKQQVGSVGQLLATLESIVSKKWGAQNTQQPTRRKYVKYSNNYQARAIIDFDSSTVYSQFTAVRVDFFKVTLPKFYSDFIFIISENPG